MIAGWIMTTGIWFILATAIFFVGHLQQLKLSQNYDAFLTVFRAAGIGLQAEKDCHHKGQSGLLLRYERCIEPLQDVLPQSTSRAAVLQDLSIDYERLTGVQVGYGEINSDYYLFGSFLNPGGQTLGMQKKLYLLADEGSSVSPAAMLERLEGSKYVWGEIARPARQLFADYQQHIKANDGVWRTVELKDWLAPWQSETPANRLQSIN